MSKECLYVLKCKDSLTPLYFAGYDSIYDGPVFGEKNLAMKIDNIIEAKDILANLKREKHDVIIECI